MKKACEAMTRDSVSSLKKRKRFVAVLSLLSIPAMYYSYKPRDEFDSTHTRYIELRETVLASLIHHSAVNCTWLFSESGMNEQWAARYKELIGVSAKSYASANCYELLTDRYITDETLLSQEEKDFPIALQLLVYKDVWQFERLLRAIYRPQNFYCVHVDLRASEEVVAAVDKIKSCFSNLFTPSQRVAVYYGRITQLDAELACMRELYKRSSKWKYLINLTGQEWPLKTNWQLVRILKALNGSNAMEATAAYMNPNRREQLLPFANKYNITPVKGATHIVVVRGFVQYVLQDAVAIEMHNWLQDAPNPDETLFPTLNHNPQLKVPGSYLGVAETDPVKYPYFNRLKNWGNMPCHGLYRNSVCVWGVADLPYLTNSSRKELFVNKLIWSFQHMALHCLEEWFWFETLSELEQYRRGKEVHYDVSYYASLPMTTMHVP